MLIKRASLITGEMRSMQIDVTEEQLTSYQNGQLAQCSFPHLTAAEREFIISGTLDNEWDELFNGDEY